MRDELEITDFVSQMLAMVFHLHGSITSWVRTPTHNALVGGKQNSKHLVGLAVDVVWDNTPLLATIQSFLGSGSRIHLVREATHDHFEMEG